MDIMTINFYEKLSCPIHLSQIISTISINAIIPSYQQQTISKMQIANFVKWII